MPSLSFPNVVHDYSGPAEATAYLTNGGLCEVRQAGRLPALFRPERAPYGRRHSAVLVQGTAFQGWAALAEARLFPEKGV